MGKSLVVSCALLAACTGSVDSGGDPGATADANAPPTETDFDRAMMQIAASYKTFSRIDNRAYASTLGAFTINVFVHGDARDYRAIHPETTTTSGPLTVGTVIVREVLDTSGAVSKLTLMAKGPTGYDPTLGDWWFGEAGPDGVPLVADGAIRLGRLTDCHGCHVPRASDDFLFGVPRADQGH